MNFQNFICTTIGFLLSASTLSVGQCDDTAPADSSTEESRPDAATTAATNPLSTPPHREHWFWSNWQFSGGQLTLPFKIRSKSDTHSFRLTTDVTVGAYLGMTKRLSKTKEHFLTIPVAAGLTFINLNSSNTALDLALVEAEVVPGLTWSTGLILQLENYTLGLMFGKDYASEVGNQWEYHRKTWWSFGIGFAFMRGE